MAELEIDKEDVHAQKEMENEYYEEEVQPYRKTDYNPLIIMGHIYIYQLSSHKRQ